MTKHTIQLFSQARCVYAMTNESRLVHSDLYNFSSYSFQINQWFLKPLGVWPVTSSSASKRERGVSLILNIICYAFILFTIVPCFLRLVLEDESFHVKLKILGPLFHWCLGTANYTTLLLRAKDINDCVNHMEIDWRTVTKKKHRDVMLQNAKYGRYVAVICAIMIQSGIMSFSLMMALTKVVIEIGNETRIVRLMPCAVYNKIFAADRTPMNEIMLISQLISGFIVNTAELGIFGLAAVFTAHACGQLSVLMIWITDSVNKAKNRKGNNVLKETGTIVEHHLRVLNFISHIEEMFNRTYFLELFRCIAAVCVLGYYILTEWADGDVQSLASYFIIFIAVIFNTLIICYIGEILTEECGKVGEVVYMTDWYYLPVKNILDLILIIARSSVVVQITAGKLVHLSIYTFSDVMKSSFAYLNIVRQMTQSSTM